MFGSHHPFSSLAHDIVSSISYLHPTLTSLECSQHLDAFSCITDTNRINSFTAQIKLHSLLLRTSPSPSAPRTLRLLANADIHDFSAAEDTSPTQEFELSQTSEVQELPVKRARFNAVQRLCLFFPDNFSDGEEDETRISYIGFKGEWMTRGQAPKNIIYEAAARPTDHTVKGTDVRGVGHTNRGQ